MENIKEGFINPYGFIPLGEKKSKKYTENDMVHSGVITYKIETKTPLFIPNTSNADAYDKDDVDKCLDFFSYKCISGKTDLEGKDNMYEPVIPGSEIRGMVRSVYEAITNSCMNVLNEEIRPVKRTGEIYKGGLIHRYSDGRYVLEEAEDCLYQVKHGTGRAIKFENTWQDKNWAEGEKVYFNKIDRKNKGKPVARILFEEETADHPEYGYLIKGVNGPKKHNAHIMIPTGKALVELKDEDIRGLLIVIENYQEQPNQNTFYKEYEEQYRLFLSGEDDAYFPVYYSQIIKVEKSVLYLSPAAITKEISNNSIGSITNGYSPCDKLKDRCPACDLFGMVGVNNEESKCSLVRFSDAYVTCPDNYKDYYDRPVLLPEMSAPKLGNTEFYLKKPDDAYFWTYDYKIKDNGVIELYTPSISGRKFYWNQPEMRYPQVIEQSKRNVMVRPVRAKKEFVGKVYFDKISDVQLNQLIWILNSGNRSASESDIVFKLGAAKPLGFGSVLLTVTEVKERKLLIKNGKLHYINKPNYDYMNINSYADCGFDLKVRDCFLNLVSFEKMRGYTICYPVTDKQAQEYNKSGYVREGFRWFSLNHPIYSLERGKILYDRSLCFGMPQHREQNVIDKVLPTSVDILPLPIRGAGNNKIIGHVKSHSHDGRFLFLSVKGQKDLKLHVSIFSKKLKKQINLREQFPVGKEIMLEDQGKDDKGYQIYKFIK